MVSGVFSYTVFQVDRVLPFILLTRESAQRNSSQYRTRFLRIRPRDFPHARQYHRRIDIVGPDAVLAQLDRHGPGNLVHSPL